jgi:hypothetical protein
MTTFSSLIWMDVTYYTTLDLNLSLPEGLSSKVLDGELAIGANDTKMSNSAGM